MGKKAKVGKQRKDKFYQLAKETGYRSRAAFKLIQLNRKFEFLQKSRVAIDLCAAPGGWLQVCQKYMPVSSIIVGVDLVPIKTIHNVITLTEDITTQKCRKSLQKELKTWKADLVLNDGAPNVGKSWLHDSFTQVRLTLSALQLASEFLMKGGWFVTKVFRSRDYNALMWVLSKLFKKVCATKPQASRNESAEIFVVCQCYLAPDKIDPKFFDPTYLFEETDKGDSEQKIKTTLLNPTSKQKKAKAVGYRDGDTTLHYSLKASEFIQNHNHIELLSRANEIICDTDDIANHPLSTEELKECIKDVKVLGRKELLQLLNWRRKLKEKLYKKEEKEKEDVETTLIEPVEEEEEEMVDNSLKRKKKKILKERRKLNERMNLKMIIKNDQLVEENDNEIFQLSHLTNRHQVQDFEEFSLSEESDDDDDSKDLKRVVFDRDEKSYQIDEGDGDEEEEGKDELHETIEEEEVEEDINDATEVAPIEDSDEEEGLITKLGTGLSRNEKQNLFFKKGIFEEENFGGSDDEMDLGADDDDNRNKQKKKLRVYISDSEDSDDDLDMNDYEKKLAAKPTHPKCQEQIALDPESLALGEMMIKSSKAKRDLMDDGWNRYTRGVEENLPSWFRKDEEKHFRKPLPVPEELVEEYRANTKGIDKRSIKKVVEAKARKKKRALMKVEKIKKRAESITDQPDMSENEKASHLKSLYKKALKGAGKKKEVTYVVAKKGMARSARPKGVKGKYKVVDSRMKKDLRNKTKGMEKKGGGKKTGGKKTGRGGQSKPQSKPSKARGGGGAKKGHKR